MNVSRDLPGDRVRPKVLVLLAACNGAQFIVEQVESILDQADVDISLLISDDGSTDDTLSQVARFIGDPRVRIVSPPAPTGSAGRNFTWMIGNFAAVGCDFVALSDQDDIWSRTKVSRGCSQLRQGRADGYSCAVTALWPDGRRVEFRQVSTVTSGDFLFEGAGQGCTYIMTAAFHGRLQEFLLEHTVVAQAVHYHDWAIYALSRCWGLRWVFDGTSMMTYRQHAANDTGARLSVAGVRKRLRLIRNGWYSTQISRMLEICVSANARDPSVSKLSSIMRMPGGWRQRILLARFCKAGGRRRFMDRWLLIVAALMGWIGSSK